ncbi:MAG: hypothetical protein A2X78_03395 [Gammaproteobacteria bacterium GWE2_37_16]|nr:MAG: hypothetical protein A2X78_03395 [Gammaproteobacteria bacterium GWE2_37_16]
MPKKNIKNSLTQKTPTTINEYAAYLNSLGIFKHHFTITIKEEIIQPSPIEGPTTPGTGQLGNNDQMSQYRAAQQLRQQQQRLQNIQQPLNIIPMRLLD